MVDHLAELFDDDAVYRRTVAGQRELVLPSGQLSALERRFLSVVTGHTPLRVLIDFGADEPDVRPAIAKLLAMRLIELPGEPWPAKTRVRLLGTNAGASQQ